MTAELLSIALLAIVGLPIVKVLATDRGGTRLAGEAFLFGAGLAAIVMLVLSLASVSWSAASVFVPMAAVSAAAFAILRLRARKAFATRPGEYEARPGGRPRDAAISAIVDLSTVALFLGFASFVTLVAPWEWDFWAIWGLKAKVFFAARGIDWDFLGAPWYSYAHGDYPPLLSLTYVVPSLIRGEWSDRWLVLVGISFAAAAVLVFRGHVLDETGDSRVAAIATLAAAGPAFAGWVALADVPLLALGTAGVLSLRRAVIDDCSRSARSGAVLLGLAALTKNEGVALLVAVVLATFLSGGRRRVQRCVQLWPAIAIPMLWQIPRLARGLSSDLFAGVPIGRLDGARVMDVVHRLAIEPLHHPFLWAAIAGALLVSLPAVRKEAFLVLVLFMQFAFVFLTYVVTANDIAWQVQTSWKRVADHIALIALFLAVVAVYRQHLGRSPGDA